VGEKDKEVVKAKNGVGGGEMMGCGGMGMGEWAWLIVTNFLGIL
jgi:hypothetical protein